MHLSFHPLQQAIEVAIIFSALRAHHAAGQQDDRSRQERDLRLAESRRRRFRRLILTIADVNKAFEKSGNAAAAAHPEEGYPDDTFIDLYVADVAVPTIGRSLLGDDAYNRLAGRLKPGQQPLIVAGSR